MTVRELFYKNFRIAFPSVLNETTGLNAYDLLDSSQPYIMKEIENLYGADEVVEKERRSLKKFLQTMDDADCTLGYYPDIEKELKRYIYKFPNQPIFRFCHIYYLAESFIEKGPSDKRIIEFYKSTLEHYPNLITLDDFFKESKFLLPILLCEKHPKELIGVFRDAIQKYPGKVYLKYVLSKIYETNNAVDSALSSVLEFLGQLETDKVYDEKSKSYYFTGDDITAEDFHLGLLNAANLSFRIGDHKSCMIYCNKILQEYEQYAYYTYAFQILFIDPTILRLKIFMIHSEEEFRKDFELLKSKVEPEVLLQEEYRSIILYAKKIKLY